jgi:hypothetical protein
VANKFNIGDPVEVLQSFIPRWGMSIIKKGIIVGYKESKVPMDKRYTVSIISNDGLVIEQIEATESELKIDIDKNRDDKINKII